MRVYHVLSKIPFAKNKYALKFFLIALPIILLVLVELVLFRTMLPGKAPASFRTLVLAVVLFTNIAVFASLYYFDKLVVPLRLAKEALDTYRTSKKITELPDEYTDEAGDLMTNIHTTLTKLDHLISEKSDMIDLLSHDLRSPVGRILSLSNLIKTDKETDKDIYADYITNECNSLLRLLENILLMLKEDSGSFTMANVNLKVLVHDTIRFFDFAIAEKNLEIKLAIDESIYVPVQMELFTQAVRNIIGNAIKFSPDGKSICISGKQDINDVSLSIQDEGLGFKPKDIQHLFDRFTKAGKKGTRGETSIGLGLYLSKKIVERHGGTLLAESEGINRGASFTIVLKRLITKKTKGRASANHDDELSDK